MGTLLHPCVHLFSLIAFVICKRSTSSFVEACVSSQQMGKSEALQLNAQS